MTEAAIRVDEVSKRFRLYHERNQSLKAAVMRRGRAHYEEFWALRNVSLTVTSGTTFGLIGQNGSGKSTLLKCMARILRPDKGTISTTGKVSALLELGAGFHPELSGRDNVYLNGSILGLSRRQIDQRFDDIVQFAGLERFIDTPVKNYSSGMYVRLGFSVAINVDPDVLLVDEVLAVGDEQFQRRCAEKFADLKASGKTIVIVSHNMRSVRDLCDAVAWLEGGVVRALGVVGDVIDAYVDESMDTLAPAGMTIRSAAGQARIKDIKLLDSQGRPTTNVRTGEEVTLRICYHADEAVQEPVFALSIHTADGILVTGPNSGERGHELEKILGAGHVDLHISRLMLLPGSYDVGGSIHDGAMEHTFDEAHRALRFEVEPGSPREAGAGLVSLGGEWTVESAE